MIALHPAAAAERERCLKVVRAKRASMRRATTPNDGRGRHVVAKLADRMFEDLEDAISAGTAYAVPQEAGA